MSERVGGELKVNLSKYITALKLGGMDYYVPSESSGGLGTAATETGGWATSRRSRKGLAQVIRAFFKPVREEMLGNFEGDG